MSRQFATNVTTIYDIFCPVPFLPSPFGFRRKNEKKKKKKTLPRARPARHEENTLVLRPPPPGRGVKTLPGSKSQKLGRKKEPKPKLFGPDIFQWGGGLTREWVGAKKFDTSPRKPGKSNFLGGISRDFAGISRGRPKSLRKKSLCSISVP